MYLDALVWGFRRACSLYRVNGLRRNGGYVDHGLLFADEHASVNLIRHFI